MFVKFIRFLMIKAASLVISNPDSVGVKKRFRAEYIFTRGPFCWFISTVRANRLGWGVGRIFSHARRGHSWNYEIKNFAKISKLRLCLWEKWNKEPSLFYFEIKKYLFIREARYGRSKVWLTMIFHSSGAIDTRSNDVIENLSRMLSVTCCVAQ